uniref:Transmembrane protein 182-like n=1 Tax=Erpetoichthys calabaricus TaxID=27687 RepID=A0A8C4SX51_ERPCA
MKVRIAALIAGTLGALGVLCFLTAFGTDYWLMASENCGRPTHPTSDSSSARGSSNGEEVETTFHHEGFFWRCWFQRNDSQDSIWNFLFTNQASHKFCIHGYLFPLPVAIGPVPHPSYDATAVFRGFWTAFIVLAITVSLVGGFLLVCAVPFASAKLYRWGGVSLITAGGLFTLVVSLFIVWKEVAADLHKYILLERSEDCQEMLVSVQYGWSFMFASSGIPLTLLSGLLFYLIGRHIQRNK